MPSCESEAVAPPASELHPRALSAPCTALDKGEAGPAFPAGSTDVPLPIAGQSPPQEPPADRPGALTPHPEPTDGRPPSGNRLAYDRFPPELQASNELGPKAPPSPLPPDGAPGGELRMPHDLGHDHSPSLTDFSDDGQERPPSAPHGRTVCGQCGADLLNPAAIDEHILLHRSLSAGSSSTSLSSSAAPGPPVPPAGLDSPPSLSPSLDPAFPFVCPVCRARYKTERGLNAHVDRLRHFVPLGESIHEYIGVPSGTPTQELLHLLATTFTRLAKQLPPSEALSRFLSVCRKMDGSGRLPPPRMLLRMLLRRGLLGRAWQAVQSEASQSATIPEPTGEERLAVIRELHPAPPAVTLPPVALTLGTAPKITAKALVKELKSMKAVAAGPSGLGKAHLLHLCERADAADLFVAALAPLLTGQDWTRLKPLAEFRLKLLAKPNGKWRPIAIQETLLVALHRALLKQTPALRKLPAWQLAFEPMAQVKAIRQAEELKRDHHLLTVDVRNAFNSVPHPVILFALHRARVPQPTVAYIAAFLRARHSRDLPAVPAGVPQGDPLSMALFCQSIVWPIESSLQQYRVLAYADDLIVASPPSVPADAVRRDAARALASIGLCVEASKCTSTQTGAIAFMGTRIIKDAPFNLGEQAARSLAAHLDVLAAASLSRHDRLRLLVSCIVPSVNYGPLVDAYPGPHSYADVDRRIISEVAKLLGVPEPTARALALSPRAAFGLGLVLPSHYHADMQAQRSAMQAGTFRDLRKKRLAHVSPLRSFLPLALLRGPPLSDDEVLFVGECLAGHYQKGIVMGLCAHCKQPMRLRHHLLCKAVNGIHVARHTRILNALVAAAKGRPGYVALNPAVPVDHLQPDLTLGDGFGDLVVTVPWRVEKSYALKLAKYRPLVSAGRASHILPVVIGSDGTLHPESAAGLAHAGVDLLKFLHEAALIILWHLTHSATAFAALTVPSHSHTAAETRGDPLLPISGAPLPPAQQPSLPEPSSALSLAMRAPGSALNRPGASGARPRASSLCAPADACPAAAHEPSSSPSVELFQPPSRADPPDPLAPGLPDDPGSFRRSRAPSPPPLDDCSQGEPPPDQAAEPPPKSRPPIFKRIDAGAAPGKAGAFYPFKRVRPPGAEGGPTAPGAPPCPTDQRVAPGLD